MKILVYDFQVSTNACVLRGLDMAYVSTISISHYLSLFVPHLACKDYYFA